MDKTALRELDRRDFSWTGDMNIYSKDLHHANDNLFSDKTSDEAQTIAPDALGDEDDSAHDPAQSELPKMTIDDCEFDWNAEECTVQRQCNEVAAYLNPHGDLVIRERSWPEDHWVVIAEPNIQTMIDRLCDLAGIGGYDPNRGER